MEKKYNVMDVINELRKIIRKKVLMVGGRPVKNTSKKDVYDTIRFGDRKKKNTSWLIIMIKK